VTGNAAEPSARRMQLERRLAQVQARLEQLCAESGRDRSDVELVVVTKTFPASDVRLLSALGVTDVGENREQEASAKVAACADLPLRWHFVGQLQTNKAPAVASYAYAVHSVDRPALLPRLDRGAAAAQRRVSVLLQVNLDPQPAGGGRGGAPPAELPALAEQVSGSPNLDLRGVMAVAPQEESADLAFRRLAEISTRLQRDHPQATWISAGMSGDFDAALRWGATHVRIGSAVLGERPLLR
jgi:pyridoxal phosphate enzyme (YggS family)